MSTYEEQASDVIENPSAHCTGSNSSVTVDMEDTVGAVFLGILSVVLLIGWMRAEARVRALITQQDGQASVR